ncbi:hypothetical protein DC363_16100 [Thalassorhabdomicrobium marinisediminis]|uniref:Uncharacterized protein n=2 Tax=Thalassorhabdomicrobium marinisediminis TaxID=2170577 RepID=A0A2T7FT41_9RHOB|nr:hypothetical protein DC363_16100 [Thalassorhabdomicrobium marinisediminis]
MESGGDYQIVNSLNYLGAYQFGEAALTDLGFVHYDGNAYDNNYSGGWTGKHGVRSASDFLRSRDAQDKAAFEWVDLLWSYAEIHNIDHFAWTEVGGSELTPSGMIAAMHLLGPGALAQYIASNGTADLRDPYGTPIVTYITTLADYEMPFAPVRPSS